MMLVGRIFKLWFLMIALAPAGLSAEIVNCDGVWTNLPCSRAQLGTMYEQPASETAENPSDELPAPFGSDAAREKDLLVRSLEKANSNARRTVGRGVDVSVTRQLCRSESTSLDECKQAVLDKERQIDELLLAANSSSDGGTNVTVVDNRDDDYYLRGRRGRHPHHHHPDEPIFGDRNVFPKPGNPNILPGPAQPPPSGPPLNRESRGTFRTN